MVLAVHFVARNAAIELIGVDPKQIPLLSGRDGYLRRVVELWDPEAGVEVADIVMNAREIPEALTLMYEADEVHVHGVVPRVAARMLPQAKLDALESTPLIVHGPWTGTTEVLNLLGGEREQVWPGPVRFDDLARACWRRDLEEGIEARDATGRKANPEEDLPRQLFIDVHQGYVLPVEGLRVPDQLDGQRRAKVFLAPEYSEAARQAILEAFSGAQAPNLDVEVIHASGESTQETAYLQRTCQLVVAPCASYWSASAVALRAMAQAVPLVAVGDRQETDSPPGIVAVDVFEDLEEIFGQCVEAWSKGNAAPMPLDPPAARRWLLERVPGEGLDVTCAGSP